MDAKYAPDAGQPQSYKGGRKWIFNICPFNPEHDNKSATLTETPEGSIGSAVCTTIASATTGASSASCVSRDAMTAGMTRICHRWTSAEL
jgi:hypothetical protein